MIDEVVKRLKGNVESISFSEQTISPISKKYVSKNLKKDFFRPIDIIQSNKKIAFVDGGNTEVISRSDLCVQFVRIFYVVFQGKEKLEKGKYEFFVITRVKNDKFDVEIVTNNDEERKFIPNVEDLNLNRFDSTIRSGLGKASVSKPGNIARQFSELCLAKELSSSVDYIVLDGTLQEKVTNHGKYLGRLFENCEKNGCKVFGLSKSTDMLTENGKGINSVLMKNGPDGPWLYYPVFENIDTDVNIGFVKLNSKSDRCFRFEFIREVDNELLSLLSMNSSDPVFLGYPYGLIVADQFARVSNQEKEYYSTLIRSKARIELFKDSHDILDSISF